MIQSFVEMSTNRFRHLRLLKILTHNQFSSVLFRLSPPRRVHQGEVREQRALRRLLHQPPLHDQGGYPGHSEGNLLVSITHIPNINILGIALLSCKFSLSKMYRRKKPV